MHWLGAVAIQHAWPLTASRLAATILLALAGVNLFIIGLSPENVNGGAHLVAAVLGLVLFFGPQFGLPRGLVERLADYPAAGDHRGLRDRRAQRA